MTRPALLCAAAVLLAAANRGRVRGRQIEMTAAHSTAPLSFEDRGAAEETLRVIQALQTGGLCQAEWKPGQKTLNS